MLTLANMSLVCPKSLIKLNINFSIFQGSIVNMQYHDRASASQILRQLLPPDNKINPEIMAFKIPLYLQPQPNINWVDDKPAISPNLSVLNHLEFWSGIYSSQELIPSAIEMLDLGEYLHQKISELSSQNLQKLSLIRLLICHAFIWIIDIEDFNNYDMELKKLAYGIITIKANNGGIILLNNVKDPEIKSVVKINLEDFRV